MDIRHLAPGLSVSEQIFPNQLAELKEAGFRTVVCNRPDGEGSDQPLFAEIKRAAEAVGIEAHYLPAESGKVTDEQGIAFGKLLETLPKPVLAYCRSGMRSTTMWALSQAGKQSLPHIVETAKKAGFDMKGVIRRIANQGRTPVEVAEAQHAVVIIGGGAAGIAAASSLLARAWLDVAIIDPADVHYYQPGWTLVGGGVFDARQTARTMGTTCPAACIGSRRRSRRSNPSAMPSFSMGAGSSNTNN
jgi:sulfide:quinone oxidoreductase